MKNNSQGIKVIDNAINNVDTTSIKDTTIKYSEMLIVADSYDQATAVIGIDNLVKDIFNAKYPMFYINEDETGKRRIDCNNKSILNALTIYIHNFLFVREIKNNIQDHKLSPYIGLLAKHLTTKLTDEISPYLDLGHSFSCTYNHDSFVKTSYLLNKLIKNIRIDAATPEFKVALNKYLMISDVGIELEGKGRADATFHEAK